MDRRSTLGWIASVAEAFSATDHEVRDGLRDVPGRPSLWVEPDGTDRWRIRSWEWHDDAWRPIVAHAIATPSGIELHGRVAAADQGEMGDWVAERRA